MSSGNTDPGVITMAKQGMARPDGPRTHPKNDVSPVPSLQGEMKTGKKKANPVIAGTAGAGQKVFHEKPVSRAYRQIDNDLARDNLENDIPMADLQDI